MKYFIIFWTASGVAVFAILSTLLLIKAAKSYAAKLVVEVAVIVLAAWLLPPTLLVLIPYFVWKEGREINNRCREATGENLIVATSVAAARSKTRAAAQSQVAIAQEKICAVSDLNNLILPLNVSKRSMKRIIEGAERRIVS